MATLTSDILPIPDLHHLLTVSGLRLESDGETLRVLGDTEMLTDEQKAALGHHKATLLAICQPARGDAHDHTDDDDTFGRLCDYFDKKAVHTRALGRVSCPFCGSDTELYDADGGLGCSSCECFAYFDTRDGGLMRADVPAELAWVEWDAPLDIDYSRLGLGHPAFEKPLGVKPRRSKRSRN